MKKILTIVIIFSAVAAQGKDIDLKKYGAKADGKTKVTAILQKAIDEVSASGGGRVILSGGTFLITPIEIKSGVDLHIEADAVLLASPDIADYPEGENPRHYLSEAMPRFRNASIIYADQAENIAISGRGTIDCNGKAHVKVKDNPDWTGWEFERIHPRRESLPRVVFFAGCRNVTVTDITMTNQPAGWSYWVHDCDMVHFDRCKILADVHYPNNDGIHINCSRNVTVSNCIIETGDDSIVVRANSRSLRENKPCEMVVITNCSLRSWSAGIRLAWTNDGVIRNCTFSNLTIYDTSTGLSIALPPPPTKNYDTDSNDYGREPTLIENLTFSNIQMEAFVPIYGIINPSQEVLCDAIRNLNFTDIDARCLYFPTLTGREENCFEKITFTNCTFEKQTEKEFPDERRHGATNHISSDTFTHVKDIEFNNTKFTYR